MGEREGRGRGREVEKTADEFDRYKILLRDGERRGEKVTEVLLEEKEDGHGGKT